MSEVKVNKITPTADCGTVTLGDSGDTVAIPSGVTLTSAGSITNSGTITNTGTISGGTITGTIDGSVNWQTTVKTTAFTATAGEGYFCNTTSAAFTVTLPASPSAGDIVGIKDYANTADTNNITIGRNGSNIQGTANDFIISTEGLSIVLLYVDATKGWLSVGQAKASDIVGPEFVAATGGTVTTSGNFKIHTFTGPGTFTVSNAGNSFGSNSVDYLVVAGGGGSGDYFGAGGGAGGFRESCGGASGCYTTSPLAKSCGALPVSAQGYPITVGGGGAGGSRPGPNNGASGGNATFSTITSTGGGGGGGDSSSAVPGNPGGSGGGGGGNGANASGGSGNTPPVSPPQGNNGGGNGPSGSGAGGGGGAGGAGTSHPPAGNGGVGAGTAINPAQGTPGPSPSVKYFAGGGNGTGGGTGGYGGGGQGTAGTANTGGGAGNESNAGGSGIVIIRYKFQ